MKDIKERLGDKVIRQIRQDIASGKWPEKSKIPSESELMEIYQVGRSTIREAVKSLVESGILKVQQGSGTFVSEPKNVPSIDQRLKHADFDELNAVRKLLELEIVSLASINRDINDLESIKTHLNFRKQAIIAEKRQDCINADIAFHAAIASASGNKVLADLYGSMATLIRVFFQKREQHGVSHFALSQHLHEQLFVAIENADGSAAKEITNQILENNY